MECRFLLECNLNAHTLKSFLKQSFWKNYIKEYIYLGCTGVKPKREIALGWMIFASIIFNTPAYISNGKVKEKRIWTRTIVKSAIIRLFDLICEQIQVCCSFAAIQNSIFEMCKIAMLNIPCQNRKTPNSTSVIVQIIGYGSSSRSPVFCEMFVWCIGP